jgi:GTP-binding protein HflX
LESLGCGDTPIVTVLNKCDLIDDGTIAQEFKSYVRISAKNGTGIDELLEKIEENLPVKFKRVKLLIPFANAKIANEIRTNGTLISEEYVAEGIEIEAVVDEIVYAHVSGFEIN